MKWLLLCLFLLTGSFRAAAAEATCAGDCNGDAQVTVDEVVRAVAAALGDVAVNTCEAADGDASDSITVDEIVVAIASAIEGCRPPTATPAPPTPAATATPTALVDSQLPPTTASALRAWLQTKPYLTWHAESGRHPSGGPHGGKVRTFLNDRAFDSLTDGLVQHPSGSAVVKELYFDADDVIDEWAVEIKLEEDSAGGDNWYWYEGGLNGRGLGICTNCHGGDFRDYRSKDFILTRFPLQ